MLIITTTKERKKVRARTYWSVIDAGFSTYVMTDVGKGPWQTWFDALRTIVHRHPGEPYYGVMQDDIVLCRGVKAYLASIDKPDVFSIFSPANYKAEKGSRWAEMREGGHLWMAQTLFFSEQAAKSLLSSSIIWRVEGTKQIDNRVGLWAESVGLPVCYHTPSLAQHTGEESTIWGSEATLSGNRIASDFVGEDFEIKAWASFPTARQDLPDPSIDRRYWS